MKLINRFFPSLNVALAKPNEIGKLMEMHGILADVIPRAPRKIAEITCYDGTVVEPGAEVPSTQFSYEPRVRWPTQKDTFYFLCMLDADVPSRKEPTMRHWQHWLVGNIPQCDVNKGTIYTEYAKSVPCEETGLHRYVFLVYKQPGLIRFPFQMLTRASMHRRGNFSVTEIARRYNLNDPIAGNFVHAKLGRHMANDWLDD